MKKHLTEFIGTFYLVLTIGCNVVPGAAGLLPPLAIGAALMAVIYAGGHICGAHYNPAVTIAMRLRGSLDTKDFLPYLVAQCLAAAAASAVVGLLYGPGKPLTIASVPKALAAEFLFTFALVFVILQVAIAKGTRNNSFYGLAIGFIVVAGAFSVGGLSGAAFNPAVAIGAAIMKLIHWGDIWIHFVAEIAGSIAATTVFKFTNPEDNA